MSKAGDKHTPSDTQYLKPRRRHKDQDKIADDAGGYQAARVEKKLDQLEAEGIVLKQYTDRELRIMLVKKFEDDAKSGSGLGVPSRQVMVPVIKRRLHQ